MLSDVLDKAVRVQQRLLLGQDVLGLQRVVLGRRLGGEGFWSPAIRHKLTRSNHETDRLRLLTASGSSIRITHSMVSLYMPAW